MKVRGNGASDVGKKRDHNEDTVLVDAALGLFLVADGMGGHAGGEVASATAAQVVRDHLAAQRSFLADFVDTDAARTRLLKLVDEAMQLASQRVHTIASSEGGKAGMGTTLTLVVATKTVAVMGHVGDSRLYIHRSGRMHQLSEDHTYVNEMVRRGMTTLEDAKRGPYANVITRAVGIQASVRADTLLFDLLPGDTLLLCSDGLSKHCDDVVELAPLVGGFDLDGATKKLIDLANVRGGSDNISAVLVRAEPEPGDDVTDRSRTTEVNLKLDTLKDIALFRHLDMGELCKVLNAVRVEPMEAGGTVVREGEPGERLYAILEGHVLVSRAGKPVCTLGPGAHFGEMALFNNRPRSATVRAKESARLIVMERTRFNELLQQEPQLGVKLVWAFAQVLSLRLDETSVNLYGDINADRRDTDVIPPFRGERS